MSHAHRRRRGVAPRPSDKDIRLWDRLLKRAEAVAQHGPAAVGAFAEAADKAGRAVMPIGHQHPGNAFSRLVRLAEAFDRRPPEREADLAELRQMIGDCRAALGAMVPVTGKGKRGHPAARLRKPVGGRPSATLPFRKDIDG